MSVYDWNERIEQLVDWLSMVYYPLLETVFHIYFKQFFHDIDSLEKFLLELPDSFFDGFLLKYRTLFDSIKGLAEKRTKNFRKVKVLGAKKSAIVEIFLKDIMNTYDIYREKRNVKINVPVKLEEVLP